MDSLSMEMQLTGEIPMEFRESEDQLPIFTQSRYADFIRSFPSRDYSWAYNPGHHILMPFATSRRWGFTGLRILFPAYSRAPVGVDLTKRFLNKFVELVKERNIADFISQSPEISVFETCPDHAVFVEFGTYVIDLGLPEEVLFNNIFRSHRNRIRKAKSEGVTVRHGTGLLEDAHGIISHSHLKAGHSGPARRDLERYIRYLPGNATFFVSYHGGKPQSAVFYLHSRYSSFALMAGSYDRTAGGSNNLLHWEAMLYFKEQGVRSYDLVGSRINPPRGSKYHGLNIFKRKFGGTLTKGYLWRYPLNYKYRVLRFFTDRIWPINKKFSMRDIIDQELERRGGEVHDSRGSGRDSEDENE